MRSNFETRFEKKVKRLLSVYTIVTVVFLAKLFRLNNISIYIQSFLITRTTLIREILEGKIHLLLYCGRTERNR